MYQVLFNYGNLEYSLVEIKLDANLPRDQRYHWLLLDHRQKTIQRLTFRSMEGNQRVFVEGELTLYPDRAEFMASGCELLVLPSTNQNYPTVTDYLKSSS